MELDLLEMDQLEMNEKEKGLYGRCSIGLTRKWISMENGFFWKQSPKSNGLFEKWNTRKMDQLPKGIVDCCKN